MFLNMAMVSKVISTPLGREVPDAYRKEDGACMPLTCCAKLGAGDAVSSWSGTMIVPKVKTSGVVEGSVVDAVAGAALVEAAMGSLVVALGVVSYTTLTGKVASVV